MSYPKPIGYYANEKDSPLFFHMLNVGEGLMILIIFPDKTTMLYDCNVRQEDKDRIIEYLGKYIPDRYDPVEEKKKQWIDIFVNSHRDLDHYRGLKEINVIYKIKSIWDSGQTGETTQDADYQYYMRLRRSLIDEYGDNSVLVPVPSKIPVASYGSADIYCLCSSQEFKEEPLIQNFSNIILAEAKIQHTNSVVLSIRYSGKSILVASDSDWKAWKEKIVPNFKNSDLLRTNILVASHHGSRSFFTDEEENDCIDPEENPTTTYIESICHIEPSITLISCGEYDQSHHPNTEAVKIYKKHTANEQVYTTNEKETFIGFINACGNWTIVPSRFRNKSNCEPSFDITCIAKYNGNQDCKSSGSNFLIGTNLEFSIIAHGGLLDPTGSIETWWEVSNGSVNNDHEHQEIYYKSKNEDERDERFKFCREVRYEGKHLLRCGVKNRKKGFDVTKIFIVNGVHNEI